MKAVMFRQHTDIFQSYCSLLRAKSVCQDISIENIPTKESSLA